MLVDVRHSPCPSDPTGSTAYGPKPWTLQRDGGLIEELQKIGIAYTWLPELGNPQKNDRQMAIFRWHLAERERNWPVHRGLSLLGELVSDQHACCLLCACEKYDQCHRRLIVEAFCNQRPDLRIRVIDMTARGPKIMSEGSLE